MADDPGKQTPPTPPPAAAEEEKEPTYSVEELRENARSLLGVSPHVAFGALAVERKQNFTVDEAKDLCKAFLKHKDETRSES